MPASLKSTLAGIFFLALSVILFEIALTRVFAIMMWHHFTYMVISIGLLGFGASGSLLTATRLGVPGRDPTRALTLCSLAYGASVVLAFCVATRVPLDSLAIWKEKENFAKLFLIYLIIGVPFLLGGFGIGLALTRLVQNVNKLYFADLLGSALGAGLAAVLLKGFGSTATVVLAGCFGLLAAFCFGLGGGRRMLLVTVPGLLLAAVLAVGFTGGGAGVPAMHWSVPFAPGKEGAFAEQLGYQIERIWSATAEVEVGPDVQASPAFGGDNGLLDGRLVEARTAAQDGTAPTMLYKHASKLELFPFLDDTQAASAYVAHRASGRTGHKVMVIGVGGGVDVMVALANGAQKVTAVELNTGMVEMVQQRHAAYLDDLFTLPDTHALAKRIELVNSEGRAWLRTRPETYDVIQMSGVDSYTALSTGAYTLSESYLYTTEAVQDFYEHLTDDGIVCYSRFVDTAPALPRETLRLCNIAATALRELGVPDARRHVAVFQGVTWASTMVKKSPFTAAEVAALSVFAREQGFVGLICDPLLDQAAEITTQPSHFAPLRDAWIADMGRQGLTGGDSALDVLRGLFDAAAMVARGVAPGAAMLPPVLQGPRAAAAVKILEANRGAIAAQSEYMLAAIGYYRAVVQDDAAARERFIHDYAFHIAAATDDAPFFFNYYKYANLFAGGERTSDPSHFRYHTDFPVGHMVLLASMLQIVVLASLLIFLPLRRLAREGMRTEGVWRYFGYFAALGLGFMFIEITLMQKLVIFLGHPTYALSVVLASLLGSAGIGSLLAGRIREVTQRHVRLMLLAIVVLVLLEALAVNRLLPLLLGLSLELRIAVVVLLLLPTGLVLGMPFPTGMRILERQAPQLLPWGWAVNAFFSVFASIFCIVLSMAIGFTNVLLLSIAIYGLGLWGMRVHAPSTPAGSR